MNDSQTLTPRRDTETARRDAQAAQAAALLHAVSRDLGWEMTHLPASAPTWTLESPASGWRVAAAARHGRLVIKGLRPGGCTDLGGPAMPQITIRTDAGPAAVTAAIRRRLLPDYEQAFDAARAAQDRADASRAARDANCERIAATLPNPSVQRRHSGAEILTSSPTVWSVHVDDDSALIRLGSVPIDLAETILLAVADYYRGSAA